jgi:mRNA interferase MazF
MTTASTLEFGDVVLVSFPFTDQAGIKKRPAVVISSRAYNASRPDVVIMAITSQVRIPLTYGEAMVDHWQDAGLLKASVFKPVFATVEQTMVLRGLGQLAAQDIRTLRAVLDRVIG